MFPGAMFMILKKEILKIHIPVLQNSDFYLNGSGILHFTQFMKNIE
jgi:tetrahydromethanopterin S-methyltransferase subunit C